MILHPTFQKSQPSVYTRSRVRSFMLRKSYLSDMINGHMTSKTLPSAPNLA